MEREMVVQTADPWMSVSLAVCVGMLLALPPLVLSENGWGSVTYQVAVWSLKPQILEGKNATIQVQVTKVENWEGYPHVSPVSGAEVYLTVSHGQYAPETGSTGPTGFCGFTYMAPDRVEGPLTVTVNALGSLGDTLLPQGSCELEVVPAPEIQVRITGPEQIVPNGSSHTYTVRVTSQGLPVEGAQLIAGASRGDIDSPSHFTNSTGHGTFLYTPPAGLVGSVTLSARAMKDGYRDGFDSKSILLVEEIGPLQITLGADRESCKRWGSLLLICNLTRMGHPVEGARIEWTVTKGWLNSTETWSDSRGSSLVAYTATSDDEVPWSGAINAEVEVDYHGEAASQMCTFHVGEEEAIWGHFLFCTWNDGQLFSGEELVIEPRCSVPSNSDWDFIAGFNIDLVIWNREGGEFFRSRLAEGLDIDGRSRWDPEPFSVFTVPGGVEPGSYPWDIQAVSPNGVHTYGVLPTHLALNLQPTGADDWTILFYIAGDNNLAPWFDRSLDMLEAEAPEGEFEAVFWYDRTDEHGGFAGWEGAMQGELEHHGQNYQIDSDGVLLGDVDSGYYRSLKDFMFWGSEVSPAGHYCLVLNNHGGAYDGSCWDYEERTHLENAFLANLFSRPGAGSALHFDQARRDLDLIIFDACLMASFETAYTLRHAAKYMVGATTTVRWPGIYTPGALALLREFYELGYGPTPLQLGSDFLAAADQYWGSEDYPFAMIDLGKVGDACDSLDLLCTALVENWEYFGDCFKEALEKTPRIEGPSEGIWWLMDLGVLVENLKNELSTYIIDPVGWSAVKKADDLLDKLDLMIINRIPVEGYTGVNIYVPQTLNGWASMKGWYRGRLGYGHAWYDVLDKLWITGHQSGSGDDPGTSFFPLDQVEPEVIDSDQDGCGDIVVVDFGQIQLNTSFKAYAVLDLFGEDSGLSGGSMMGPFTRVVQGMEPGESFRDEVLLIPPYNDTYRIILSIVAESGNLVYQRLLGNGSLRGSPGDEGRPRLRVNASRTEVEAGDTITLTADAEDPDGNAVEVWWDLDDRDGILVDSTTRSVETRYLRAGNLTVTCIASDGAHCTVDAIEISVRPATGNLDPVARLHLILDDVGTVLANGSASMDPDGDRLQYRFSLGDGTYTGWQDSPVVYHTYGSDGNYTCTLKVRDLRGGESGRVSATIDAGGLVPNRPPTACLLASKTELAPGVSIEVDAQLSEDGDDDPLEYRFDWGDGSVAEWAGLPCLEHVYGKEGSYTIILQVRDPEGLVDSASIEVVVGEAWLLIAGLLLATSALRVMAGAGVCGKDSS